MVQLETGKTKEALITLLTLYTLTQDYYNYYEQTRWYLALASLKLHNEKAAKKYLDELVALDGVYLDRAKGLLQKMKHY